MWFVVGTDWLRAGRASTCWMIHLLFSDEISFWENTYYLLRSKRLGTDFSLEHITSNWISQKYISKEKSESIVCGRSCTINIWNKLHKHTYLIQLLDIPVMSDRKSFFKLYTRSLWGHCDDWLTRFTTLNFTYKPYLK